jgi:rhodanese-related sulfurtransferase
MSGAPSPQRDNPAYAGDVSARETWERLVEDKGALLVDVRSRAEWSFVGVPDLEPVARTLILVEWQSFPPGPTPNPDFASELAAALESAGYAKGKALFFLCRSGARSRRAAIEATEAGLGPCFNVSDGFEGALDAEGHRGTAEGWKAAGLPWVQS